MKLSLIASALLAAVCLGAMDLDEVTGLKPSEVGKKLVSVLKQDNMEELLAAFLDQYEGLEAIKKHLGKVSASQVRSMGLHKHRFTDEEKNLVWVTALLPEVALREVGKDQLRKVLRLLDGPMEDYANFPAEFFKDEKFAKDAFENFTGFVDTDTDTDENDFLCTLTLEQFGKLVANVPNFHGSRLSGRALNRLASALGKNKCKKWMGKVTPKFLDSLNKRRHPVRLHKEVVASLPNGFLNEIKVANNPADAQYYTEEQLKAFKKARAEKLDFTHVPPKMMQYLSPDAIPRLAKKDGLTVEQLNKFTAAQWNELLSSKEGCKLVGEDVKLKNVSSIEFSPRCFSKIDPKVQAYVLTHHNSLPDDILSYVTASMVEGWETKKESGLNILRSANNPRILAHIGSEVREEDEHPLQDVEPSKLAKKLPHEMMTGLTSEQMKVMKVSKPKSLDGLRKEAEWVCYRKDIFDIINGLSHSGSKRKGKKGSKKEVGFAWSELTALDMEKLTGPSYSRLASSMTLEVFAKLQPAAAAAMSPRAVASLPILKTMSAEQYRSLAVDAFGLIGPAQHAQFKLVDVSDVQLPHVSELAQPSLFSVLPAEELQALGNGRLALLVAAQWAAVQPAVFRSVVNAGLVPSIPPVAMTQMTEEQWSQMPGDVLASLQPAQVEQIGNELPSGGAFEVLKRRAGELKGESQAALQKRTAQAMNAEIAGNGASSLGFSLGLASLAIATSLLL